MSTRRFARPPRALIRPGVRFVNVALIPASLLPFKAQYDAITRTLPQGSVLLVLPRKQPRQRRLLVDLARRFAARGHPIATRTAEEVRRV